MGTSATSPPTTCPRELRASVRRRWLPRCRAATAPAASTRSRPACARCRRPRPRGHAQAIVRDVRGPARAGSTGEPAGDAAARRAERRRRSRPSSIELELDHVEARRLFVTRLALDRVHQLPLVPRHHLVAHLEHRRRDGLVAAERLEHDDRLVERLGAVQLELDPVEVLAVQLRRQITISASVICRRRSSRSASLSPGGRLSGVLVLR